MTEIIVAFAYYAILFLGALSFLALCLLAIYGVTRLYVWVIDRILIAKDVRSEFIEFMWDKKRADGEVDDDDVS